MLRIDRRNLLTGVATLGLASLSPRSPRADDAPPFPAYATIRRNLQQLNRVGGLQIGTAGPAGSIYSGFVMSAGDDFEGNTPDIVSPLNPSAPYFDVPSAQNAGAGNTTRGKLELNSVDVGPYWSGANDANRGVAPLSWQDMLTQSNGQLHLKGRVADQTTEWSLLPWGQHELGAAINGAGAFSAAPPCIIEYRVRMNPGNVATGALDHPSLWWHQLGSVTSYQSLEGDFEGGLTGGGTLGSFESNAYVWASGSASGAMSNSRGLVPNLWDGAFHVLTFVFSLTDIKYFVDGNLTNLWTVNTQPDGFRPFFWIVSHHIMGSATVGGWATPAMLDLDWVRVWRSATSTHRVPATTVADIYADFGAPWTITVPSAAATWGSGAVTDIVEAMPYSSRAPGGTYQGCWAPGGSLFPPGVSYANGTISGTITDQPGRIYFIRNGAATGDTMQAQRFCANIGPRILTAANINASNGSAVAYDFYADCDVGDLGPPAIAASGLSALGLSIGSAGTTLGKITGTLANAPGSATFTVTNAVGQAATKTVSFGTATPGSGLPAPVFPNFASLSAAGLVAALDFDNDTLITTVTGISQAAGAYGTAYAATQATGSAQPTRLTIAGRKSAKFAAASSQSLSWASLITGAASVFAGPHTIVVAFKLASSVASSLIDVCLASATTTANRSSLLCNTTGGHVFRSGSATWDAVDGATSLDTVPHIMVGRRFGALLSPGLLNVDKTRNNLAASKITGATTPDTCLIGARQSATATIDLYGEVDIFEILVFNRCLEDYEVNILTSRAAGLFGTA